jgi:glycosyltransferase involved in cell wall biosynthesis
MRKRQDKMNPKENRILINAMVIHPNYGSEFGFPWFWLLELSKQNLIIEVISGVHEDNIQVIEKLLKKKKINNVTFHFIPFPNPIGFSIFKNKKVPLLFIQTTFKYWIWHWKAYKLGKRICSINNVDVVHQLNTIGFRLPGFMGLIKKPFVWGPIGGGEQYPLNFLSHLNQKGKLHLLSYNLINYIEWNFAPYINWCLIRANALISSTSELAEMTKIKKFVRPEKVFHIPETACLGSQQYHKPIKNKATPFRIAVVCFFQHRKNLPFLFDAIKQIDSKELEVKICGEGPSDSYFREYAKKLQLKNIQWLGWTDKLEGIAQIKKADVLIMPTIREANTNVIFEALGVSTPVICIDVSGMKDTITNNYNGFKIKQNKDRNIMVQELAQRITSMMESPELVSKLSEGALKSANNNLYANRINALMPIYMEAYQRFHNIY